MKVFQETTDWSWPNHVYFLSDSKDKMYAYINTRTGLIEEPKKPYRFSTSGRRFKEVENRWNFVIKEDEPVETTGRQYQVPGSKGAIYTVTDDAGVWSCTCPASKWQKGDCKHIVKLKLA